MPPQGGWVSLSLPRFLLRNYPASSARRAGDGHGEAPLLQRYPPGPSLGYPRVSPYPRGLPHIHLTWPRCVPLRHAAPAGEQRYPPGPSLGYPRVSPYPRGLPHIHLTYHTPSLSSPAPRPRWARERLARGCFEFDPRPKPPTAATPLLAELFSGLRGSGSASKGRRRPLSRAARFVDAAASARLRGWTRGASVALGFGRGRLRPRCRARIRTADPRGREGPSVVGGVARARFRPVAASGA